MQLSPYLIPQYFHHCKRNSTPISHHSLIPLLPIYFLFLNFNLFLTALGFPGGSAGKESTCNAGDLGWEDTPAKGTATHSSILAWRIPWTIWSMGSQRVRHVCETFTFTFHFWLHWIFIAALRLSLVAASRVYSRLQYIGFSLQWLLLLQSTGSRARGLP